MRYFSEKRIECWLPKRSAINEEVGEKVDQLQGQRTHPCGQSVRSEFELDFHAIKEAGRLFEVQLHRRVAASRNSGTPQRAA